MTLDRNVLDSVRSPGRARAPADFFRHGTRLRFVKGEGRGHEALAGTAVFSWFEGGHRRAQEPREGFEFDIEYRPGYWTPMERGLVRVHERGLFPDAPHGHGRWRDYPPRTRLGWRGPAVPAAVLPLRGADDAIKAAARDMDLRVRMSGMRAHMLALAQNKKAASPEDAAA